MVALSNTTAHFWREEKVLLLILIALSERILTAFSVIPENVFPTITPHTFVPLKAKVHWEKLLVSTTSPVPTKEVIHEPLGFFISLVSISILVVFWKLTALPIKDPDILIPEIVTLLTPLADRLCRLGLFILVQRAHDEYDVIVIPSLYIPRPSFHISPHRSDIESQGRNPPVLTFARVFHGSVKPLFASLPEVKST